MHGAGQCVRPGCGAIEEARLTYHYVSRTAWLAVEVVEPDPATYELCTQHADRFTVPVGWNREDRRTSDAPVPRPISTAQELLDIPLAVLPVALPLARGAPALAPVSDPAPRCGLRGAALGPPVGWPATAG